MLTQHDATVAARDGTHTPDKRSDGHRAGQKPAPLLLSHDKPKPSDAARKKKKKRHHHHQTWNTHGTDKTLPRKTVAIESSPPRLVVSVDE